MLIGNSSLHIKNPVQESLFHKSIRITFSSSIQYFFNCIKHFTSNEEITKRQCQYR